MQNIFYMESVIRKIRNDLRLSMNGAVANSMRTKGVNYRMNFGVEIPRIIEISKKYDSDKFLAETLWEEDVRELKIMATLLYPFNEFAIDKGITWSRHIKDQELREQACKNLFQNLNFSNELVDILVDEKEKDMRCTGYWLFARLCIIKSVLIEKVNKDKLLNKAVSDLESDSLLLRQSALNGLKFFGRTSKHTASNVLLKVVDLESSENMMEREMFDLLKFEFDMMYDF